MVRDSDGIDRSQELTPKQVKAYAEFRRAKGQVQYNNGSILSTYIIPIDELHRRKIIEDGHHWAGEALTRIYTAATMHMGYRRMRELIAEITGGDTRVDLAPIDILTRVVRSLQPWQYALIERWCFRPARETGTVYPEGAYQAVYAVRSSLQGSFDAVADTLRSVFSPQDA